MLVVLRAATYATVFIGLLSSTRQAMAATAWGTSRTLTATTTVRSWGMVRTTGTTRGEAS